MNWSGLTCSQGEEFDYTVREIKKERRRLLTTNCSLPKSGFDLR